MERRNMENELSKILSWMRKYQRDTNCKGVVLGISGGKDSTVVAMLAKKVWGDNVFGILMPNGEQKDILDSLKIATTLGIKHRIVNIETVYNSLLNVVENRIIEDNWVENCPKITNKAKTNIPPRLRMTILYAVAQTMGYRVIGTGNASEAYIGWTTKWGDSAYDFNPIAHLTCTEVMALGELLAEEFGLDKRYVIKTPSDGLCGKSDEDSFGFSYEQLDHVIDCRKKSALIDITPFAQLPISSEIVLKIDEMYRNSKHKRELPLTLNK